MKIDGLGCTTESKSTKAQPGVRWQHGMYPDSRAHQRAFDANSNGVMEPSAEFHGGNLVTDWNLTVTGYLCLTGKC